MKQQSRRPGMGSGSIVSLSGRRSEPTENTLEMQRRGHSQDWSNAPDLAALS